MTKRFKWLVDDDGGFYRSAEMYPMVRKAFEEQKKKFVEIFGREPEADDPVFFEMPSPKAVQDKMVEVMLEAGIPLELIYAYIKTDGLIVTAENQDLLPDKDLREWHDAISEYRRLSKKETDPRLIHS